MTSFPQLDMANGQTRIVDGRSITTMIPRPKAKETIRGGRIPKKRVAAYARVSTDEDEQKNSYEAQVDYFTTFIQKNENWEFVGIYADEGISATNTKRRDEFNRMVKDGLDGKIDLILSKSISRFARNTVDALVTIRSLKEKGVNVFFEKENMYSMDANGELVLTLLSSLAQEESRSISENVTWGIRKRFADGKVSMPYKQFLGFRKGENGKPEIVEEEAAIIRNIFRWFKQGMSPSAIARQLTNMDIPSPAGKQVWRATTVRSILANEKYKGDALLQKTYIVDFLTKKAKVNEGEIPRYYVENSHPAIIDPEEFDGVQVELAQRDNKGGRVYSSSPFSMKLVCADCGSYFGPKVWQSNTKYRRTIWRCNKKYSNEDICKTTHLSADRIKEAFLEALALLHDDREELASVCDLMVSELCDCTELDRELDRLETELAIVEAALQKLAADRAHGSVGHEEYSRNDAAYHSKKDELAESLHSLKIKRQIRQTKGKALKNFKNAVLSGDAFLTEFDETLWLGIVEKVFVNLDGVLDFHFINGVVVRV